MEKYTQYTLKRKVKRIAREYEYDADILPFRTVGVMGDERTYEYTAVIRVIGPYKENVLAELATRIPNEVRGINRVVRDITPKKPLRS